MSTRKSPRILIVDDDPDVRELLADILTGSGYSVVSAENGLAALDVVAREQVDLVLLDLVMPGLDGLGFLGRIRESHPGVPVIVVSASNDVPVAVETIKLGAFDFITKPFDRATVLLRAERALERRALEAEIDALKGERADAPLYQQLGEGEHARRLVEQIRQVAQTSYTILICGETGTGKELIARAIHEQSPRHGRPFIPIDCGAIPENLFEPELFGYEKGAFTGAMRRKEGYFELAQGGTIFLDEVGNLPVAAQSKLLRVIQERQLNPVGSTRPIALDIRIIAASNVPFEQEIEAGRFRNDLYYRLAEFTISVPPLSQHRDDVLRLANRFLVEAGMELRRPVHGIAPEAAALLLDHTWPGNVRELRNVIRQAALRAADVIQPEHLVLPPRAEAARAGTSVTGHSGPVPSLKQVVETAVVAAEREAIRDALTLANGNKSEAARLLKTNYKTLHVKIKQYGLAARPRATERAESA